MKATELIKQLSALVEKNGDLDVAVKGEFWVYEKLDSVTFAENVEHFTDGTSEVTDRYYSINLGEF